MDMAPGGSHVAQLNQGRGYGLLGALSSHDKALLKWEGEQPGFNMTRAQWPYFKRLVIDWLSTVKPEDEGRKGALLLTCLPKPIRDSLKQKLRNAGVDPNQSQCLKVVWDYLMDRFDDSSTLTPLARLHALTIRRIGNQNGGITLDTWEEFEDEFKRRLAEVGHQIESDRALELISKQLTHSLKADICAKEAKSDKKCFLVSNLDPEKGLQALRLALQGLGLAEFQLRAYDGTSVELLPAPTDVPKVLKLNGASWGSKKLKIQTVAWRMDCQEVFDFIKKKLKAAELAFYKEQAAGVVPKQSYQANPQAQRANSITSQGQKSASESAPVMSQTPQDMVVCFVHGLKRLRPDTISMPRAQAEGGGCKFKCKMGKECPNIKPPVTPSAPMSRPPGPSGTPPGEFYRNKIDTFPAGNGGKAGKGGKAGQPQECWECQKAGKPSNHSYLGCQFAQNIIKARREARDKGKSSA